MNVVLALFIPARTGAAMLSHGITCMTYRTLLTKISECSKPIFAESFVTCSATMEYTFQKRKGCTSLTDSSRLFKGRDCGPRMNMKQKSRRTRRKGGNGRFAQKDNNTPKTRLESSAPLRGSTASLFNSYTIDDDYYSGLISNRFIGRFVLFVVHCDPAHLPKVDRRRAFSIILGGSARQFHYDVSKKQHLDLMSISEFVKDLFQTLESMRAFLSE